MILYSELYLLFRGWRNRFAINWVSNPPLSYKSYMNFLCSACSFPRLWNFTKHLMNPRSKGKYLKIFKLLEMDKPSQEWWDESTFKSPSLEIYLYILIVNSWIIDPISPLCESFLWVSLLSCIPICVPSLGTWVWFSQVILSC